MLKWQLYSEPSSRHISALPTETRPAMFSPGIPMTTDTLCQDNRLSYRIFTLPTICTMCSLNIIPPSKVPLFLKQHPFSIIIKSGFVQYRSDSDTYLGILAMGLLGCISLIFMIKQLFSFALPDGHNDTSASC